MQANIPRRSLVVNVFCNFHSGEESKFVFSFLSTLMHCKKKLGDCSWDETAQTKQQRRRNVSVSLLCLFMQRSRKEGCKFLPLVWGAAGSLCTLSREQDPEWTIWFPVWQRVRPRQSLSSIRNCCGSVTHRYRSHRCGKCRSGTWRKTTERLWTRQIWKHLKSKTCSAFSSNDFTCQLKTKDAKNGLTRRLANVLKQWKFGVVFSACSGFFFVLFFCFFFGGKKETKLFRLNVSGTLKLQVDTQERK